VGGLDGVTSCAFVLLQGQLELAHRSARLASRQPLAAQLAAGVSAELADLSLLDASDMLRGCSIAFVRMPPGHRSTDPRLFAGRCWLAAGAWCFYSLQHFVQTACHSHMAF
jgi:hypothetical protein